jgi:hypothetical protein
MDGLPSGVVRCPAGARPTRGQDFLEINFLRHGGEDPAGFATRIGKYLGLEAEEIALSRAISSPSARRRTKDRDLLKFLKLSELPWSDTDKHRFIEITSQVSQTLGYGLEQYFER